MTKKSEQEQQVSNKILTIPNVISFVRLCLIPVFFYLLLNDYSIAAAVLFGVAASTDWIDGQVARRTNSVSKLGQTLDPVVDRLLMISGVFGAWLVGRLPLWIIILVLARDAIMLAVGSYLMSRYHERPQVIFAGKLATTFLFFGFFGQLLNFPTIPGLGITQASFLPGFSSAVTCWGIWFVYAGLILGVFTTTYYAIAAIRIAKNAKQREREAAAAASNNLED